MAKIKMKYHDFELEIEGEESFVENKIKDFPGILDKLLSSDNKFYIENTKLTEFPKLIEGPNFVANKSIGGFLREKNFTSDTDLIIGVIYFLYTYENMEMVTSKDIKECLRKAKQSSSMNIQSFINSNIRKGFVEECEDKKDGLKAISLLDDGIKYIEGYEPKTDANKTKKKNGAIKIRKLSEDEDKIVKAIKNLDIYDIGELDDLKTLKNQKQIVMGSILLIDKYNEDFLFNSTILYEFIRHIGLNVSRANISSRISEMNSYFDKQDNGLLKLSNYGKNQMERVLRQKQES